MEQISDKELASRWGEKESKIKAMCNPNLNRHYCPSMFHPDDFIKLGKKNLIFFNLSLNPSEMRPRVLQRPIESKVGNPNFKKKKPLESILGPSKSDD